MNSLNGENYRFSNFFFAGSENYEMAEGGEDNNNSELDFSRFEEKSTATGAGDSTEFENVGGLSVIERDQRELQQTLANDVTLDGRRNPHSTYFRNSSQDTLSDVFGPNSSDRSRVKWDDSGCYPSLEEAADAIRTMPLGGDLMSAFMGMNVTKLKSSGPGQLIYSSHQSLSWFNSPLWSESTRTVVLKNKTNTDNVKVSIKIDCKENCFKLAGSERHGDHIEVTLEPLSTFNIPISFHPVRRGQVCSRLVVTYSNRRFYIFLYGYGGASSVFCRDADFSFNYNQPAVFVSETTPTASFVLYNSGDEDAIFAISNSSSDCTVSPVNGYLPPNGSLKIFVRCKGSLLNAKPSRKPWPVVEKVTVTVEDKTTFLRIDKMKYIKDETKLKDPQYDIINKLLDDPVSAAPPEKKTIMICVCVKPR